MLNVILRGKEKEREKAEGGKKRKGVGGEGKKEGKKRNKKGGKGGGGGKKGKCVKQRTKKAK